MKTAWNILKHKSREVDWQLLGFLVLVLDVKLVVKLLAVCFIYVRRFDLSFKFSFRQTGIPFFYPAMIGIAVIDFIAFSLYHNHNYAVAFITGIAFWLICILVLHQLSLSVKQGSLQKIHNTVLVFFIINAVFSFVNLFAIMYETGTLNPYNYVGMYQKYFIGTGDYIRGATFDTSTTNAILNAFGIVYFLSRKQMWPCVLCMIVLLMTGSNFTNLLIIICFIFLFIVRSDRDQKSIIMVNLALLVIFMVSISPQNNRYAISIVEKAMGKNIPVKGAAERVDKKKDTLLSIAEQRKKIAREYMDSISGIQNTATGFANNNAHRMPVLLKPEIPIENIQKAEYHPSQDTSDSRLQVIKLSQQLRIDTLASIQNLNPKRSQGKITAMKQTITFLQQHPVKILMGAGMGNFSSKLAFRTAGLKIAGGYPQKYVYINKDFQQNHLSVYLDYFSKGNELHSVVNMPNAVYIQLLSEYGIVGLLAFVFFYLLYFLKKFKRLTYGLPLLLILLGAFWIDYWYEQLSVVIFFELLMLLDLRGSANHKQADVA